MIAFDWDPLKAAANLRKHRVSFEEAKFVFYDEFAVQFFDEEHSIDEERFILPGDELGSQAASCLSLRARTGDRRANHFSAKSHQA